MQEHIDISDLDFNTLLKALWYNTIIASFFTQCHISAPEYKEPEIGVKSFDYHCGRPIKMDFSDPKKVHYFVYDRDAGEGKFLEIVNMLRKETHDNYIESKKEYDTEKEIAIEMGIYDIGQEEGELNWMK